MVTEIISLCIASYFVNGCSDNIAPPLTKKNENLTDVDLRSDNLAYQDFSNRDLTGADLRGANLTGATFYNANLTDADLTGANLTGAILTNTDLTRADLIGADLRSARLDEVILDNANLTKTKLEGIIFPLEIKGKPKLPSKYKLINGFIIGPGINLGRADFGEIYFEESQMLLINTDLRKLDLTGANFKSFNFINVDFSGAILKDAIFDYANLLGANFTDANLENATFKEALYNIKKLKVKVNNKKYDLNPMKPVNFNFKEKNMIVSKKKFLNLDKTWNAVIG